jgi:phthiodiolone/phenolphthiodiolone dimycocerosates ketoreductase
MNLMLRLVRLFGVDTIWLADHFMNFVPAHVWKPEFTPAAKRIHSLDGHLDPLQILAVTAVRSRRVNLATGVTEAIRRHPMSLAQSFVTLDHLSKGRAILGIGNGERENIEPYGLPWKKQVSRLEEALTIIRLLWESRGTPVDYDGQFWKLKDAVFNLPLYNDRPPRIWIGAHAPRMLGLTGRFGDGWIPAGGKMTPEEYASRLNVIKESAAAAGRSMETFVPGQMLFPVVLGKSRDQALDMVMKSRLGAVFALLAPGPIWKEHGLSHPLGEDHGGWYDFVPPRVTEEDVERAMSTMTPELLLATMYLGSPQDIFEEAAALVDAGARHIAVSDGSVLFTGDVGSHLWRLGSLIRKVRRLESPEPSETRSHRRVTPAPLPESGPA